MINIEIGSESAVLEAVRVTEAAAIAAFQLMGRGLVKEVDAAAVRAMRETLGLLHIEGTVVIGEGERDEAPMLYIGEKVGTGYGPQVSIALDPLEGTTICAYGRPNSMSVIAMSEHGGLLNAPDVYMEKIAIGVNHTSYVVDLDNSIQANLGNLAKFKKCDVSDLIVVVLDRPRHDELISKIREAGSRIVLIDDGDIAAVMSLVTKARDVDMYVGIGGAPEGVLSAAALATLGGQMMGRMLFNDDAQRERARSMGITDLNRKYTIIDMVNGENVMFAATGVTSGSILRGVRILSDRVLTHSIALSSKHKLVRYIRTENLN